MRRIAWLVSLSLAACSSDRAAFRPTDNVTEAGQGGQPAASYDVRPGNEQQPTAHVNVWSRGAYEEGDQAIVRMAIEVRNLGKAPVALVPGELELEAYSNAGAPLPTPRLVQTAAPGGSLKVPPGEAGTVQLVFAIPAAIRADAIGGLRLRWVLQHDDGRRYVQFTDFQRVREYVAQGIVYYDPIFGFYDPFLYGPPYDYHFRYRVPVGRIIIEHRDRGPSSSRRPR